MAVYCAPATVARANAAEKDEKGMGNNMAVREKKR